MAESSISRLKERLNKLLHQKDMAAQKAAMLEEQQQRDRQREQMLTDLTQQLMERQRELNIMLNRANLMLNRAQEANTILSLEFTELCHALPAPEDPDVQDRIRRINDLFKTTGISDAEVAGAPSAQVDSVIVTPPPENPRPMAEEPIIEQSVIEEAVIEQPFEAIEEAKPAGGDGKKRPRRAAGRLDHLFQRSGSEDEETSQQPDRETAPVDDFSEPIVSEPRRVPVETSVSPEIAQAPMFDERPFVDFSEPIVIEEPQGDEAEDTSLDYAIPDPQPVGTPSSGGAPPAAPGRRWWRSLGRR